MEWHEVQDTGEARVPGVRRYVRAAMGLLLRQVDAHVVHSTHDLALLEVAYGLRADAHDVTVVPHGPYDHVGATPFGTGGTEDVQVEGNAPEKPFTLLFFGIIRPYKGLEDLVEAFSSLPEDARENLRLRIVGETWEGWEKPLRAVEASPARDRIDVVNRYVTDAEVREHFAQADAVVLPYRRSSASGPLHMAMSAGLPVIVTAVGGLVDAARDYEGVTFVPPEDTVALADALRSLPARRGRRYSDPHTWDHSVDAYLRVFAGLGLTVPWVVAPDDTSSHPALAETRLGHRRKKLAAGAPTLGTAPTALLPVTPRSASTGGHTPLGELGEATQGSPDVPSERLQHDSQPCPFRYRVSGTSAKKNEDDHGRSRCP